MTQHKSSMVYIPTTKEAKRRNGKSEGILNTIEEVVEKLYWTYYIHLPFYLMASFDSFFLHVFFLTIFSLSFFGILNYCFL
ncbi:CAS_1a_G0002470.mRNA.1.CDS.1 [Saccharomyces cerevisiae]|uniref:Tsc3p n=1 Tax=Saccharomyces cerevisiae (strain Lalvin EC1118 / Prise de mousse) TaxID=643680 RepID=D3UEF6_YEAS8|nr:CAS_1a_G0002470.mRNA.1.CDS.1 [Saccharomyces cerevisiae]CAI7143091.1 CAS_1a_G0002470.mRNA.1.CDS.1 [Saccharomyces cerevisiae]CBK39136.1 Tsc3p [Saccharomyces cerevisiae EC1118]